MIILTWLIFWLICGQDPITFSPAVNDWATALLICAIAQYQITTDR